MTACRRLPRIAAVDGARPRPVLRAKTIKTIKTTA
jgi:hypothetical protein